MHIIAKSLIALGVLGTVGAATGFYYGLNKSKKKDIGANRQSSNSITAPNTSSVNTQSSTNSEVAVTAVTSLDS